MSTGSRYKEHQCGRQYTALELPDIVHLRIRGKCTLEECRLINAAHLEYAEDLEYFFFLIDLADLEDLPAEVRREASATVKLLPLRGTVICNAPMKARMLAKLMMTAANLFRSGPESNPVAFADTEEEARDWLEKRRQHIGGGDPLASLLAPPKP